MSEALAKNDSFDESIALETYEDFGIEYADVIHQNGYNANFERPSTLSLLPDQRGKRVLDAGCGPGEYTPILNHQVKKRSVSRGL